MPRIFSIVSGGQKVNVIEVQFEIDKEEWNTYKLLDGGTVRMKTTLLRVFKVVDDEGRPVYSDEGDPEIIVRHKSEVVAFE